MDTSMESFTEEQKYYLKRYVAACAFMGASALGVIAGSHLNEDAAALQHANCGSSFESPAECIDSLSGMALAGNALAGGGLLAATASFVYGSLAGVRLAKA